MVCSWRSSSGGSETRGGCTEPRNVNREEKHGVDPELVSIVEGILGLLEETKHFALSPGAMWSGQVEKGITQLRARVQALRERDATKKSAA